MKKMIETKEAYEAPVIVTVEVRVEQGFQTTGLESSSLDDDPRGTTPTR